MGAPPQSRGPFVLRELRWEDFPARLEGYLALYDEVKEDPELGLHLLRRPPTVPEEADWFAGLYRRVQAGEDLAVVAEVDGRAVGMVTIARSRYGSRESETGHVGTLGIMVDRRYRSRGLGEALMRRALELARGQFEIVRLTVFTVNARARRLYERLGFRLCGHLEAEVLRNGRYLDAEMMTLDLRGSAAGGPAGPGPRGGPAS